MSGSGWHHSSAAALSWQGGCSLWPDSVDALSTRLEPVDDMNKNIICNFKHGIFFCYILM